MGQKYLIKITDISELPLGVRVFIKYVISLSLAARKASHIAKLLTLTEVVTSRRKTLRAGYSSRSG